MRVVWSVVLSLMLCGTTAQADGLTGFYFGAGIGAVTSDTDLSVTRTTTLGPTILGVARSSGSARDTAAFEELTGLYQWRMSGAILGIEGTYQHRDLELAGSADIFSPGAQAIAHIGDRGMIRSRIGVEVMPSLLAYSSVGVSYAWDNETYVRLANGSQAFSKDTSTWNTVFGGGLEYAIGDFLIDLRFTAAPGSSAHDTASVPLAGGAVATFDTFGAGGWTYDAGVRVLYKLQ